MKQRIEEMFAFVADNDEGEGVVVEGIVATRIDDEWVPLVGADIRRIERLRPAAQVFADRYGKTIRVLRFTARSEILPVIVPRTSS